MTPVYAALVSDPFFLSFDQISDLTDRQIFDVLLHPRDEQGRLKFERTAAPEAPLTLDEERELHFRYGTAFGIPHNELVEAWEAKHGPDAR